MRNLTINLFAEKFIGKANGVTTAFEQITKALESFPQIKIKKNGKKPYDVLHSHTIGLHFIWLTLKNKKRTIVSSHVVPDSFIGSLIFSKLWYPIAKLYLRFVYNRANTVIAVSPLVKQDLQKIGVRAKIEVLCNSVDRDKFKPDKDNYQQIRKKHNISLNEKLVLGVGQIQPRKGIEDFIKTAKLLPQIKFIWVGGRPYGKLTESYKQMSLLIKNKPQNVIFAGIVELEEMPRYYAAADIYFMPSFQENFAFATIEAASTKLPLVMRDNIEYQSTLYNHYLKANNARDFASLIKKLTEDKSFFDIYLKEADQLAEKYKLSTYTEKLISIYKEVAIQK